MAFHLHYLTTNELIRMADVEQNVLAVELINRFERQISIRDSKIDRLQTDKAKLEVEMCYISGL